MVGNHPKVLLFVAFIVLLMLGWGFTSFRWGGVVIEGSGAKRERSLGESLSEISTHRGRRRLLRQLMDGRLPEVES